tara:strand:- start:285 stop:515 length:231 start_codon:yes stop_codon:yes gene_type:complete
MIYTCQMIEVEVSKISGTHIKRNNLRKKLIAETNLKINNEIDKIKKQIRCLKAQGLYESDFRTMYSQITKLEIRIL